MVIPIILSIGLISGISFVDAADEKDSDTECREGQVLVFRINANNYVCVTESTAERWIELGIAEIIVEETMEEETMEESSLYDKVLNPRQTEYQNHLGFNDLHIEAINHLIPHDDESVLDIVVHHHCKVYDDMTAACLLFPTGMGDQDKPYGIEYVIGSNDYMELPDEEKKYWHYHKTELPKVQASLPDLTTEETEPLMPILNETYGKVVYFWQIGDEYPIGEPFVVIIEELYE